MYRSTLVCKLRCSRKPSGGAVRSYSSPESTYSKGSGSKSSALGIGVPGDVGKGR